MSLSIAGAIMFVFRRWELQRLSCLLLAVGAGCPTAAAAALQYSYDYRGNHGPFVSAAAACSDVGVVAIDGANYYVPVPPPGIPRALISASMIANGMCHIKYSATSETGYFFTNEFDWPIVAAPPASPRPEVEPGPSNSRSCQRLPSGIYVGNPIMPATGEKILSQADYVGEGFDALSMVRSYRSGGLIGPTTAGSPAGLGQPWLHNHWVALKQDGAAGSAGSTAQVLFGDGTVRAFGWDVATGIWAATNGADTLVPNGAGLLYKRLDDDSLWQFDSAGKLLTVTQRNGWVRTYSYSTAATPPAVAPVAGLLIAVSNQFGRTLNLAYNGAGQLVRVKTPDERTVRYVYDGSTSSARLAKVIYPGGTSRAYIYDMETPQLLTGITDEKGNRYETIAYDSQRRGTSTQLAGGADLHTVSYGTGGAVTVTDPRGTQRTYNYGTAKGKLAVTGADKPDGPESSSAASRVQDTNGFVTQETDFLGVNTLYTWDANRRLPLTVTRAAALPEVQTTATQWHATLRLPVLVTEAGRSTAYTYDSAGNMLTRTVTDTATSASRTATWTYNAQGLPLTETPAGGVTARTYAYYGSTAGFVDTVASDPYFDHVSLLLRTDGADGAVAFTDSSAIPKPVVTGGNARISAAQSKFGGSSMRLDGVRDYVSLPADPSLAMKASDFTIEMWVYKLGNNANTSRLWNPDGDFYADVNLQFDAGGNLVSYGSATGTAWNAWAFATGIPVANNVWKHVALVRAGGTVTLYVDGAGTVLTTALGTTALYDAGKQHTIGGQGVNADRSFNGYIDDVRVTKGLARYTANFTPPTQAFPNTDAVLDPDATGHTAGDLQSITNAAGHVTQFTLYDRAGRVRQMVDPNGIVTDTTYTSRGWINSVTVTPPGGTARTTRYIYDNAGQLTGVIMPDTTTMSYSYDAAHRLTGVTDAKGNTVTYTLDSAGNKTGEQVKDSSGNLQRNITRVYDTLNRVQQVTGASN